MLTDKGVHFLAIEGVIGVGKTTLARIIAERWNAFCIEENFAENPFLEKFYENKEAYAFQTQLFF
ncbi:MAG: deoxynucleoside kinase [Fibrobacter sp.]|nr:deoxynucleoside kinase [Fibrobacter sp.]